MSARNRRRKRPEILFGIALVVSIWPAVPSAQETPLQAARAFLADPFTHKPDPKSPEQVLGVPRFAQAAASRQVGEPRLVLESGTTAILAVEVAFIGLTQSIYVRTRAQDGVWSVTDWSNLQRADNRTGLMRQFDRLSEAQWAEIKRNSRHPLDDLDLTTARENFRLNLGSDEIVLDRIRPSLATYRRLCETVRTMRVDLGPAPIRPQEARAIAERHAQDPDLIRLLDEARQEGILAFQREEGGATLTLTGGQAPGMPAPTADTNAVVRVLLCTDGDRAIALRSRVEHPRILGIRRLEDGLYFVRGDLRGGA